MESPPSLLFPQRRVIPNKFAGETTVNKEQCNVLGIFYVVILAGAEFQTAKLD
jgi:hypothetical protein